MPNRGRKKTELKFLLLSSVLETFFEIGVKVENKQADKKGRKSKLEKNTKKIIMLISYLITK